MVELHQYSLIRKGQKSIEGGVVQSDRTKSDPTNSHHQPNESHTSRQTQHATKRHENEPSLGRTTSELQKRVRRACPPIRQKEQSGHTPHQTQKHSSKTETNKKNTPPTKAQEPQYQDQYQENDQDDLNRNIVKNLRVFVVSAIELVKCLIYHRGQKLAKLINFELKLAIS